VQAPGQVRRHAGLPDADEADPPSLQRPGGGDAHHLVRGPALVRPDTVRPDTVRPDTVRPDTVHPDTVHPDTVHPDTAAE
jgi:hypothetical protein